MKYNIALGKTDFVFDLMIESKMITKNENYFVLVLANDEREYNVRTMHAFATIMFDRSTWILHNTSHNI